MVRRLLVGGYQVVGTYRSLSSAEALLELRSQYPDQLYTSRLDLEETTTHAETASAVEDLFGGLDVLINNAGIYFGDPLVDPPEAHTSILRLSGRQLARMFSVNAVGPLLVTQAMLDLLRTGTRSTVAFLSSGMASIGSKDGSEIEYSYSASKAALNMLTRVLSYELLEHDIRVIALNPGWVATDMGTSRAPLDPDDVARDLIAIIEGVKLADSGLFLDWRGEEVPW